MRAAFKLLLKLSLGYSALLWALVMAVPQLFARVFSPDPALVEFAASALRVYLAALLLFGVQIACQITFTSLGNAKASILVAVMRKLVLLIPLIYILPHIFPGGRAMAVYMAEPVADTLAVTFTAVLFFFQFRKAMAKIEAPCEEEK